MQFESSHVYFFHFSLFYSCSHACCILTTLLRTTHKSMSEGCTFYNLSSSYSNNFDRHIHTSSWLCFRLLICQFRLDTNSYSVQITNLRIKEKNFNLGTAALDKETRYQNSLQNLLLIAESKESYIVFSKVPLLKFLLIAGSTWPISCLFQILAIDMHIEVPIDNGAQQQMPT